ncbi:hypothetical protein ABE42_09220 [Bacillus thuringiensis]|uniref:DUF1653 domain-containing protein n=1 Tax=Bacillus thuringiensis TaxID=1428 RepID=A0A437SKC8_BACTU|nr:DUF1653 domain-containing protein [Bacillus thuringiensis]MBG9538609.1 hypothetical protein [Bacillus thuringiensis]MBG9579395.1 hypothetical protein [Bacillus thuringiensis]RVU63648.1 DUF1653 domain-containing protein [Bacillus thuringiensis]
MRTFRHFKGTIYKMVCTAQHSETNEKLVIYQNDSGDIFARPYDMFFETIERDGKLIKRFTEIQTKDDSK